MTRWDDLVAAGSARREVVLALHTTYKLGGPADLYVEVGDRSTVEAVVRALAADPCPVLVLGRGSNLVIADEGFRGVVITLGPGFSRVEVKGDEVAAGGVAPLPKVARISARAGRGGLEFMVGIPGSVGGAVRQNAGCFGTEVSDRLLSARLVSLQTGMEHDRTPGELALGYRSSSVAPTDVVVSARFSTEAVDPAGAEGKMRAVTRWRRQNQPGGTLNAGSVFKNPPGHAAGALIEQAGLTGFAVGRARVSPRHANFFEAQAGASAAEVRRLVCSVRRHVEARLGVVLEPEVQFVGFEPGQDHE